MASSGHTQTLFYVVTTADLFFLKVILDLRTQHNTVAADTEDGNVSLLHLPDGFSLSNIISVTSKASRDATKALRCSFFLRMLIRFSDFTSVVTGYVS